MAWYEGKPYSRQFFNLHPLLPDFIQLASDRSLTDINYRKLVVSTHVMSL